MSVPEFDALMNHALTLRKMKRDGTNSWSLDQEYPDERGWVDYGWQRILNEKDEHIEITALVFLPSESNLDAEHEEWEIVHTQLNRTMRVKQIDPISDPQTGVLHHYEVGVV